MPTERCGCCHKFMSAAEGVKCVECGLPHHRVCVTLPAKGKIDSTWRCPMCKKGKNGIEILLQSKPVHTHRNEKHGNASVSGSSPAPPTSMLGDSKTKDFTIKDVMEELRAMRMDFLDFRKEISDMKIKVQSYSIRIEKAEARMDALEQRVIQVKEPVEQDRVIRQLAESLNEHEQNSFANDLEIRNVPEEKCESLNHLVTLLGTKLDVYIEERRGSVYVNSHDSDVAMRPQQPRTIIVRLARRDIRDKLLHNARVQRSNNTNDLGLSGKAHRIYVNERLTKTNSQLFRLAREVGRRNGWQFIYLARRKPDDTVLRVRDGKDVFDNIGPCSYTF